MIHHQDSFDRGLLQGRFEGFSLRELQWILIGLYAVEDVHKHSPKALFKLRDECAKVLEAKIKVYE